MVINTNPLPPPTKPTPAPIIPDSPTRSHGAFTVVMGKLTGLLGWATGSQHMKAKGKELECTGKDEIDEKRKVKVVKEEQELAKENVPRTSRVLIDREGGVESVQE